MIVDEIVGDMFKTDCQTIAIPVNKVGTLGNGLALYAKKRWPAIDPIYRQCCRDKFFQTRLITIPVSDSLQILLIPTKNHWKEDSNDWLIEHSLKILAKDYKQLNITSLAMPKIGCGKGNMDYDVVQGMLYKYLDPLDIPVKIYI